MLTFYITLRIIITFPTRQIFSTLDIGMFMWSSRIRMFMPGESSAEEPSNSRARGVFQVLEPGQKLLVVFEDKVLPTLMEKIKETITEFMDSDGHVLVGCLPHATIYILTPGENTIEVVSSQDLKD